jgi:Ser/Thr protein kinase RdoA (MazF antagonist)
MRTNDTLPKLFAGIDSLSLDTRNFNPSQNDIKQICRFFRLGQPQHYQKEKGITVSHSNFFVFVATTHGQYALKFYPADAAKTIATEYAVNRFLISRDFPTPAMYTGDNGRPSFASNDRLATCFSYIDGAQAWQHIKEQNTIHQINAAMLTLKNILSTAKERIPLSKQESFTATVNAAVRTSRTAASYDQKKMVEASLQDACRIFQDHKPLFKRHRLHNNATLTNFLVKDKTIYILDLSHIREDYILSDLAAMVISCLFLDTPRTIIKTIVGNYFTQHKIKKDHMMVLSTLVKIGLIKEYLKNVQREQSMDFLTCPPDTAKAYLFHLKARKKLITEVLKKMNGTNLIFG